MVEIAGTVMPPGANTAGRGIGVQKEEFQFHGDGVVEAERGRLGQRPRQNAPRVAGESLTVGRQEIADHLSGRNPFGIADRQGVEVGAQEHIALEDPGEALHRRAVEPFAISHGVRQPLGGNGDALDRAEHIHEAKIEEADTTFGQPLQRALEALRTGPPGGRLSLRRRGLPCALTW